MLFRASFAGGGTDVSSSPEKEGGAVLAATIDRGLLGSLATHVQSWETLVRQARRDPSGSASK